MGVHLNLKFKFFIVGAHLESDVEWRVSHLNLKFKLFKVGAHLKDDVAWGMTWRMRWLAPS